MAKFKRRPPIIEAEQYHNVPNGWPTGVCAGCDDVGLSVGPHVHTMHAGQIVELEDGDWVVPEPDGVHYYPIKDEVLRSIYEPVE